MDSIFIPSLELVKCTYKKKHFYENISLDNIMLINDFIQNHNIKLNRLILNDENFKLTIIDKNNTNYTKFENKIGYKFYPKININNIIEYIYDQLNKPQNDYITALKNIIVETECLQNDYITALKNIMIETECLQTENNNLVLTEYLSSTDSDCSNNSVTDNNTIDFNQIDTIINI